MGVYCCHGIQRTECEQCSRALEQPQKRSKHARVERLRRRLQNVPEGNPATEGLIDIVKGLLDLLDDELL